jgi:hypothetical protein
VDYKNMQKIMERIRRVFKGKKEAAQTMMQNMENIAMELVERDEQISISTFFYKENNKNI